MLAYSLSEKAYGPTQVPGKEIGMGRAISRLGANREGSQLPPV